MKKRIFRSLSITSVAAVLCAVFLSLLAFHAFMLGEARETLRTDCRMLRESVELSSLSPQETLEEMNGSLGHLRVTLMEPDGTVVYDSGHGAGEMENHLERSEVQAALATGWGEAQRTSDTLGENTIYCAARLQDGSVLRVSLEQKGIQATAAPLLPILGGIILVLLCVGIVVSSHTARSILRPIAALAEQLDGPTPEDCYDELAPFLRKIRGQQRMILQQMDELADDRGTIKAITDNMQEGLIIVSLQETILSVNSSAVSLLEARPRDYAGRGILTLSQLPQLKKAVEDALAGTASSPTAKCGSRFCQFFANPVYLDQQLTGAIVLILDVTEREKAEKMRRDFSANVSHELKTPLTSISGFAEMIEAGMATGEDARNFAGRITRESARLLALIDDIIRLSRLDEHAPAPMDRISLSAVCREVLANLEPVAKKRDITISLAGPEVWTKGNAGMLTELVTNLCDNAIKYNREGGSVTVETAEQPDAGTITLAVRDTGIGIPSSSFQRVFERFYRVDKSRSKQTGGTGLGLSIAKHIVECHSGRIAVESTLGEGSIFTVTLPAWQEEAAATS